MTTLLVVLLFGIAFGDIFYDCKPDHDRNVQIIIERSKSNFGNGTLILKEGVCGNTEKTTDTFTIRNCPAEKQIDVEWTKFDDQDNFLLLKNTEIYSLKCHWNETAITLRVKSANFHVDKEIDDGKIHKTNRKQNVVTTSPWKHPNLALKVDPNTGSIGDLVNVTITSSDRKHSLLVEKCIAFTSTNYSHTLLKNCTSADRALFPGDDWMKTNTTALSMAHHLQLFRFKDSFETQLECTVRICPIGREEQCSACTSLGRRRRSVDRARTVVRTTFSVMDEDEKNHGFSNSAYDCFSPNWAINIVVSISASVLVSLQMQ